MGKIMVSLTDKSERMVRSEIQKVYHGKTGGLSIFFEDLVRKHFEDNNSKGKSK